MDPNQKYPYNREQLDTLIRMYNHAYAIMILQKIKKGIKPEEIKAEEEALFSQAQKEFNENGGLDNTFKMLEEETK
jgi:hypothetical protein